MVLTFTFADETLVSDHSTWMVRNSTFMFFVLCEVVLTCKSGDKNQTCDHSMEITHEMQLTSSSGRHFAK